MRNYFQHSLCASGTTYTIIIFKSQTGSIDDSSLRTSYDRPPLPSRLEIRFRVFRHVGRIYAVIIDTRYSLTRYLYVAKVSTFCFPVLPFSLHHSVSAPASGALSSLFFYTRHAIRECTRFWNVSLRILKSRCILFEINIVAIRGEVHLNYKGIIKQCVNNDHRLLNVTPEIPVFQ